MKPSPRRWMYLMTDVIRATLLAVKDAAASGLPINDKTLLDIEKKVRLDFEGERVTVSKNIPRDRRYELYRADLDAGLTYQQTASRHGVSKRTVLRAGKQSGDTSGEN